jgi:hypothetical protein
VQEDWRRYDHDFGTGVPRTSEGRTYELFADFYGRLTNVVCRRGRESVGMYVPVPGWNGKTSPDLTTEEGRRMVAECLVRDALGIPLPPEDPRSGQVVATIANGLTFSVDQLILHEDQIAARVAGFFPDLPDRALWGNFLRLDRNDVIHHPAQGGEPDGITAIVFASLESPRGSRSLDVVVDMNTRWESETQIKPGLAIYNSYMTSQHALLDGTGRESVEPSQRFFDEVMETNHFGDGSELVVPLPVVAREIRRQHPDADLDFNRLLDSRNYAGTALSDANRRAVLDAAEWIEQLHAEDIAEPFSTQPSGSSNCTQRTSPRTW